MSECPNGMPAMWLEWTNITVKTDQSAITRGIGVSIGTPPQIVSLRVSTTDEVLFVVNSAYCAPENNATCVAPLGGVFDYNVSTTFQETTEGRWNGSDIPGDTEVSFVYFNDVFSFGNATVYGQPAVFSQFDYGGQGAIPLGFNSDFLRAAVEQNMIPSTVYGLWTGSRSINFPVAGSLVLGGYDRTRLLEEPTAFDSGNGCTMCAVVTELEYEGVNGTVSLFSNASDTIAIGLNPATTVLNVPQHVWENFRDASGGIFDTTYDVGYLMYPDENPPAGNLTVTLQNGYKTTIPTEELFSMPRLYNEDGVYSIVNNSYRMALIMNQTDTTHTFSWGIPFMTMNYLIADFRRGQYKLAPAIRTDFSNQGGGSVLKPSCDPVTTTTAIATSSATANGTGPAMETPTEFSTAGTDSSLNVGAIAGGVVGGVVGLAVIIAGVLFWFMRNRRKKQSIKAGARTKSMTDNSPDTYHRPSMYCATEDPTFEMSAEARAEMSAESRAEMSAQERAEMSAEERAELSAESRTEVASETQTQVQSESRSEVPSETRRDVPSETRSEVPNSDSK